MTPYKVDDCVVYAVIDINGIIQGEQPLMFASNLVKGMTNTHTINMEQY